MLNHAKLTQEELNRISMTPEEVKKYKQVYYSPEVLEDIRKFDLNIVDDISRKEFLYPNKEHFHCPRCWKGDFMFMNFTRVCKHCYENDKDYKEMQLCTYATCASS